MTLKEGEIFVTKLEAARRQIDAAIRMTFLNEDPLAVHTVGAAAFRILRDLKKSRGRSTLADLLRAGLYEMASDVVSGKDLPDEIKGQPIEDIIARIADNIRAGKVGSPEEIDFTIAGENCHWAEFNLPANFLKHADLDSKKALRIRDIRNDELLIQAVCTFSDVAGRGRLTDEMMIHLLYASVWTDAAMSENWPGVKRLRELTPAQLRRNCLSLLREIKPLDGGNWLATAEWAERIEAQIEAWLDQRRLAPDY